MSTVEDTLRAIQLRDELRMVDKWSWDRTAAAELVDSLTEYILARAKASE